MIAFDPLSPPAAHDYDRLFLYFLKGWLARRQPGGATAVYTGLPSNHGAQADAIEGFSRFAPLIAAWLQSGRSNTVHVETFGAVRLDELLLSAFLEGTDPEGAHYWGRIRHFDQRIVEAADIALTLWLTRDTVWPNLTRAQRNQITSWLAQVATCSVHDNNWHLLVAVTELVLRGLGESNAPSAVSHYERFKSFYAGGGWFSDGPKPIFDFYNAWAIHYSLHWIRAIDPAFDSDFIREATQAFLRPLLHLVGPSGLPIMGRSVCYRMAVPAPLVQAQPTFRDVVRPTEARRALDCVWQYFLANRAVQDGNVTQGYFDTDARILDRYSGPASCLWSLRSLIAAYAHPASSDFWTCAAEPLPVEIADFELSVPSIGWKIRGCQSTAEIVISFLSDHYQRTRRRDWKLDPYTIGHRVAEKLLSRPARPHNHRAKYARSSYSSARPFC